MTLTKNADIPLIFTITLGLILKIFRTAAGLTPSLLDQERPVEEPRWMEWLGVCASR